MPAVLADDPRQAKKFDLIIYVLQWLYLPANVFF